jgi:hypothetical protein
MLETAARPEGTETLEARGEVPLRACPASPLAYHITYPRGLDGGGPQDRAAEARARKLLAEGRKVMRDFAGDEGGASYCRFPGAHNWTGGSEAYRISRANVSVLFSWGVFYGASTGGGKYALNLLEDGTEITVGRLFPGGRGPVAAFWELVWRDMCLKMELGERCRGRVPPVPRKIADPRTVLDGVFHSLLSSRGLTISLGKGEGGELLGFGVWFKDLDIPKEDLLAMGADPAIWGVKPPPQAIGGR